MKKEIKVKNIFYSTVILVIIYALFSWIKPEKYFSADFIDNTLKKITAVQTIAPERLYVNAWRIIRNSYVDSSLNNQDWNRWLRRYSGKIKTVDDANVAINTMLSSLNDPYSKFLKSEAFAKQKMTLDSQITGIGVMFNKSGDDLVVNHVMDNSPAQLQNIKAGDTILEINGQKAENLDIETIMKNISEGKGEDVELKIKSGDKVITKVLKKTAIPVGTMEYKILDGNIGLITLTNIMGKNAVEDFKKILQNTNDTKGIIIDLRNNYGGILANAVQMANYMLGEEEIVSIKSRNNTKYRIYAEEEKIFKNKPVVILINHYTASAAEILAGSLRDNINATLIGEPSFGKNSIQHIIPMQNKSGLVLTTDKYILPKGKDIDHAGIFPDIKIPQAINVTPENDNQLKEAVKVINSDL